MDKGHIHCL